MSNNVAATLDNEYIRIRKYNSRPEGVFALVIQILCQAIKDAQRKNKQIIKATDKEDALKWIKNQKDNYFFDFINICRLLNIDPQLTRAKIAEKVKIPNLYFKYKEERK